jgi:hypothetical protein
MKVVNGAPTTMLRLKVLLSIAHVLGIPIVLTNKGTP